MIVEPGESSRIIRHISRTLATLTMIKESPTASYFCVLSSRAKSSWVGKIEHRAGSRDIFPDLHDAPRAMEHAQRIAVLRARYLIVIKLHRIDGASAELV